MKKYCAVFTLLCTSLLGCTTDSEARKNLVFKTEGQNSVAGAADCISRKFKGTPDIFLTRELTDRGVTLKVVARGQFGMNVLHVVDIIGPDGSITLEAHSPRKAVSEDQYADYVRCVQTRS